MLSCRETTELVSRSLDEPLPWRRQLALRMHLAMCSACRSFDSQVRFLREACGQFGRKGSEVDFTSEPDDAAGL